MKAVGKLITKLFFGSFIVLFISFFIFIIVAVSGVPFIEGDTIVTDGQAYNFNIGASKKETFESILKHYKQDKYQLRTLWLKESELNDILEPYENTEWKEYNARKYSEYKEEIINLNKITPPLEHTLRWDIQIPSSWVNSIYLTFEGNNLVEIQKSRWLFERP